MTNRRGGWRAPIEKQKQQKEDVLDRANDVPSRIYKLDDACATLHGFRSLLEDLNSRSPIQLASHEQVLAVAIVRAGILRSAIGLAVAMLDKADWRGNRASLGHIIQFLGENTDVANLLSETDAEPIWLQNARDQYQTVLDGPVFDRVRRLRNDEIGHILVQDEPQPVVEYTDTFALVDAIERLLVALYGGIKNREPHFNKQKREGAERAKLFWNTYLAGVDALKI